MAGYSVGFTSADVVRFNRDAHTSLTVCEGWFAFDANGDLVEEEHARACDRDNEREWSAFILELQARVRPEHAKARGL